MIDDEQETTLTRVNELGVIEEFERIAPPAPGIYRDMESQYYHKIDAASASRLKILRRSPAHLRASMLMPTEPTPAMTMGTAIHTRILEPDRFAEEYVISPKFDRRTKIGKQGAEEFEIANFGKKVIDENIMAAIDGIFDSVMSNTYLKALFEAEGSVESSIFWQDQETNVMCKGRPDKHLLYDGRLIVLDIKSALDASPEIFSKEIYNRGYHVQAGMYLDGMSTVIQEDHSHFLFIALEKEYPFAYGIYSLDGGAIDVGRQEYRRLLRIYGECQQQDRWPGYGDTVQPITLPKWAFA